MEENDFYPNPLQQTPFEIRSLIEHIVNQQEIYDKPADEDIEKVLKLSVSSFIARIGNSTPLIMAHKTIIYI